MQKLKKILSALLAAAVIVAALPLSVLTALAATTDDYTDSLVYGTDGKLTRAEWLHNLSVVFNMTVDSDNEPDNYFADLPEAHKYYSDVLLTVEFGVVNVEAGGEICPDDPATRDFTASTLNYCLGYQPTDNDTYSFSDSAECTDKTAALVAVERGWFKLISGKFSPDKQVETAEVKAMLNDALAVLKAAEVDENYDSKYTLQSGVIAIPEETEVTQGEDGGILITDCPKTISAGDKFAVYFNGIPVVYTAQSVLLSGNVTEIKTDGTTDNNAFTAVDGQGSIGSDSIEILPAEGVDVEVENETVSSAARSGGARRAAGTKSIRNINAAYSLPGGLGKVSVKIKNPIIDYQVSNSYAFVTLKGESEITYSAAVSASSAFGLKSITLFTCNVLGIGSFDITAEIDFSGSVSGTVKGYMTAGVECRKGDRIRLIKYFEQKEYYINAEVSASAGLKVSLGVTKMPIIKAFIYAEAGATAKLKTTVFTDGKTPHQCTHFAAYLYARYGASASASFMGWSVSESFDENIFSENNSPLRIVHHYEDGSEVGSCTRGLDYTNYFTRGGSRYGGCGWFGANGAYGLNADGTPMAFYTYTQNSDENGITITKYNGNSYSVYIPSEIDGYTVTRIGDSAFEKKIMSVVKIPDNVIYIGAWAFYNCDNLREIDLPKKLNTLCGGSFFNCDSLTTVFIPKSLAKTTLETNFSVNYKNNGAFGYCNQLNNINFEANITFIPENLFFDCTGLTEVTLPDTVTSISENAFYNCLNLKKITLSDNITRINKFAFYNCDSLEEIILPESLVTLCGGSFYDCDRLKKVYIPMKLKNITLENDFFVNYSNNPPFGNCPLLNDIEFEEGITKIIGKLFYGCNGLKSIVIPNTVTAIDSSAFYNCTSLTTIELSENLSSIGSGIFENCKSLESIKIPQKFGYTMSDYSSSYKGPFYNCSSLKKVTFNEKCNLVMPYMFQNCTGIETIDLPDNISILFGSTFEGCVNLKNINIPKSVENIYDKAFRNCKSLENIILPENLKKLSDSAFEGCANLKSIVIPDNTTDIGNYIFKNCSSLKSVKMPDNRENITREMFSGCSSLKTIELPSSVTKIRQYAFYGCTSLESVTFKNGKSALKEIESQAFYGCTALREAVLPETVKTIGSYAFQNSTSLEKVYIPQSVKTVGRGAFMGCTALSDLKIADYGITEIQADAFMDCPALAEVILPKGLKTVGNQAFKNGTGLIKVTIPDSVTEISATAFSYPAKTAIYGSAGSYAETFAANGGFKFNDNKVEAEGFALSDGAENIDLEVGETYRAVFEFFPENATDTVTLKSSNSNVSISGMDIYARYTGDCVITAVASNGLTYEFSVHTRRPSKITVKQQPDKLRYKVGESFDRTGAVIEVVYNDGFVKTVDDWTYTGFDSSSEGSCAVTVRWVSADGSVYTATINTEIYNPAPKLTGIKISQLPYKLIYAKRTALNTAGIKVMGVYDDGSEKELTGCTFGKINALKLGVQKITVTYGEFSTEFNVTVTASGYADGDVNQDGVVDIRDLIRLKKRLAAEKAAETETSDDPADVDKNNILNAVDITVLKKILLGVF